MGEENISPERDRERRESLLEFKTVTVELGATVRHLLETDDPKERLEGCEQLLQISETLVKAFRELARP